jgi:hypothetical protein
MAEKTCEEWLEAFRRRKVLNSAEQEFIDLLLSSPKAECQLMSLEDVPKEHRTAELCLAAIKEDGRALEYVPEELKEQVSKTVKITQVESWSGKWREDDY